MANLKSQIAGIDRAHGKSRKKNKAYLKALDKIKASDIWNQMSGLDKAALVTSPVPVIGDAVGLFSDAVHFAKEPTWLNAGMGLTGLLPLVPSAGITRTLQQAIAQSPNDIKGFYGDSGKLGKIGAAAKASLEGAGNLVKARYSPTARGLFKHLGLSVPDTKAAKKAMKVFNNPKSTQEQLRQAGKEATGQFRQSTLFKQQYKDPSSSIHDISKGTTEVDFGMLDPIHYKNIMDGNAGGLSVGSLKSIFREINKIQDINPNKTYQMTVRRTNTSAAGNLDRYAYNNKIYGGQSLTGLKKIFNGKQFKTNEDFLKALKGNKVGVLNPEEILRGKPAIVTGSVKTDARELGGVNYMTAIKKDGTLVSFANDEHDLFKFKAPKADRMINISTPISIDILNKGRIPNQIKKSKEAFEKSKELARVKAQEKLATMPGVNTSLKVPPGMTKEQFYLVQAIANAKTPKDYSRIKKELGLGLMPRASKPFIRQEEAGGNNE